MIHSLSNTNLAFEVFVYLRHLLELYLMAIVCIISQVLAINFDTLIDPSDWQTDLNKLSDADLDEWLQ